MLFADGRYCIAPAAWIAPACLLRFTRTQSSWRGIGLAYIAFFIIRGFTYRGMIPIPGIFYSCFLAYGLIFLTLRPTLEREHHCRCYCRLRVL